MSTATLTRTLLLPAGILSDGSLAFESVQLVESNIVSLQPNQPVYGVNPVITSLQEERRRALGYEVIDVTPEKPKKKGKLMTRPKAIRKVIEMRVENEHMEKKLSKLDTAEKNNVKQVSKLTTKIQDNRQKIESLCQEFDIRPKDYQTESPIRRFGRTIKEGWTSFWSNLGGWIKENAAPVTAVGLAVLAIVGILF